MKAKDLMAIVAKLDPEAQVILARDQDGLSVYTADGTWDRGPVVVPYLGGECEEEVEAP